MHPCSKCVLFAIATLCILGCETGRTNKVHSSAIYTSDVTTTGKPQQEYASASTGQPPVPGSPTAAGPDGRQPMNDYEARKSLGVEEGSPTPPREQKKDRFIRQ